MDQATASSFNFNRRSHLTYSNDNAFASIGKLQAVSQLNFAKSLKRVDKSALLNRKASLSIIQDKFRENQTVLKNKTFHKRNKENANFNRGAKPRKIQEAVLATQQCSDEDGGVYVYKNVANIMRGEEQGDQKKKRKSLSFLPVLSTTSFSQTFSGVEHTPDVRFKIRRQAGLLKKTITPHSRNFCDYYKPTKYMDCFMGEARVFVSCKYIFKPRLKLLNYEDQKMKVNLKVNVFSKVLIMTKFINFMKTQSAKEESFSIMISQGRREKKAALSHSRSCFKSQSNDTCIDNVVKGQKMARRLRSKKHGYTSKWMKIIERLVDDRNLEKVNYIGYYDIKLGKPRTLQKYLVVNTELVPDHCEYFAGKVEKDLIVHEECTAAN